MDYIKRISGVRFPPTSFIDINMMPFVIGDGDSLPNEYQHYWPLIDACGIEDDERGAVGYLTITESDVSPQRSQRRPGVHTDGHGPLGGWGGWWGAGLTVGNERRQGIYLATTAPRSCRAWNIAIKEPGAMGDCFNMDLPAHAIYLDAHTLYWITDHCPHESLPLEVAMHRQFFRVVTSRVSKWYAAHSTPNRLGIQPTAHIVADNKFSSGRRA